MTLSDETTYLEPQAREMIDLYRHMQALMREGAFSDLDAILSKFDVEATHAVTMCCYSRYPSAARHLLPSWKPMVDRIRAELSRRGEDADDIMRGLL